MRVAVLAAAAAVGVHVAAQWSVFSGIDSTDERLRGSRGARPGAVRHCGRGRLWEGAEAT